MTTTHGYFIQEPYSRPIVSATIWHECMEFPATLEFLIDTGADHTLIVPDDEPRFNIQEDQLIKVPDLVHTFVGPIEMRQLNHCSVIFIDRFGEPYTVENVGVCFLAPDFKKKVRPLMGKGTYVNVLGRDVLHQLSLGYCKRSEYVFLTANRTGYFDALSDVFPKPPEFDETVIRWLD
ncbi:MAG: hypothetical protein PHQ35_02900 [Phycisphaerae bacterium]|nr:hypothetical protein [Phycisphaerae bacterium]MDD5380759.1 hypothetical protein [Phycisphaerae bacterium]